MGFGIYAVEMKEKLRVKESMAALDGVDSEVDGIVKGLRAEYGDGEVSVSDVVGFLKREGYRKVPCVAEDCRGAFEGKGLLVKVFERENAIWGEPNKFSPLFAMMEIHGCNGKYFSQNYLDGDMTLN